MFQNWGGVVEENIVAHGVTDKYLIPDEIKIRQPPHKPCTASIPSKNHEAVKNEIQVNHLEATYAWHWHMNRLKVLTSSHPPLHILGGKMLVSNSHFFLY